MRSVASMVSGHLINLYITQLHLHGDLGGGTSNGSFVRSPEPRTMLQRPSEAWCPFYFDDDCYRRWLVVSAQEAGALCDGEVERVASSPLHLHPLRVSRPSPCHGPGDHTHSDRAPPPPPPPEPGPAAGQSRSSSMFLTPGLDDVLAGSWGFARCTHVDERGMRWGEWRLPLSIRCVSVAPPRVTGQATTQRQSSAASSARPAPSGARARFGFLSRVAAPPALGGRLLSSPRSHLVCAPAH